MNVEELNSIEHLECFLAGTQAVVFEVLGAKHDRYQWKQKTLVKFNYLLLSKREKSIVQRFLGKVTGYSRQQLTRLINQYRKKGKLVRRQKTTHGFKRRFTQECVSRGKNGAVVRKILGFSHIPQRYAYMVNDFNQTYLNPYINYHRPCFFHKQLPTRRVNSVKNIFIKIW